MRILGNYYHNFVTEPLKRVPGIDFTVLPEVESIVGQSPDWVNKFDFLLVQSHEDYQKLKHFKVKKIILEHTTPFPLFTAGNQYWAQICSDKTVKKVVFLTEDQSMRWQCNLTDHVVIPPTIDVDALPKWNPANPMVVPKILSVCHDLPARNWVCGADIWRLATEGMPRVLIGKNNEALGGPAEGVIGRKSLEETMDYFVKCPVFFNHTLHSTLPATLMEAMAIGIPIVTTAYYFSVRLFGNNYATVTNVMPELRKALDKKLKSPDPEAQEKINRRNFAFLKEHYSFDAFAANWKGLLEQCSV